MTDSAMSVFQGVRQADIRREHFPHIVVKNALPESYYRTLAETFPSTEFIAGSGELDNNTAHRTSAVEVFDNLDVPKIWREFFEYHCSQKFYQEFLSFWGEDIRRLFPGIDIRFGKPLRELKTGVRYPGRMGSDQNRASDLCLDCQFVINSPVQQMSSVVPVHVDLPEKLFAALLYFRRPGDDAGGDLELYRLRNGRQVEKFDVVRYEPNMLVMWLNTPFSIHAVTPRRVTEIPRRYINFLGESFVLPKKGFHGYYQQPKTVSSYLTGATMGQRDVSG